MGSIKVEKSLLLCFFNLYYTGKFVKIYLSGIEELFHFWEVKEMQMKKKIRISCMLGLFLMCFAACGQNSEVYLEEYGKANETERTATETELVHDETESIESGLCYVYICGAVNAPGVYALPEGSRVYEVIQAAGGLSEDADEFLINQAEEVTDGMMIQIYTQEEAKKLSEKSSISADDGKLDINTASVTELMNLPGIGKSKAEAIVAYRGTEGTFSSIEDLMKIPGIKEGVFAQLKEHIKVNN